MKHRQLCILLLTCICLMAGVPTEMTFNTTSTVMTSQHDNTMRHDNALPVTCHSRCASHQSMHMSYRCKTYTWNNVILVKRSMIRVFFSSNVFHLKIVSFWIYVSGKLHEHSIGDTTRTLMSCKVITYRWQGR